MLGGGLWSLDQGEQPQPDTGAACQSESGCQKDGKRSARRPHTYVLSAQMEFKYAMKGEDGGELFQECVLLARQFLGSGKWEVWDLRPTVTKFCKECSSDAERIVCHDERSCPKVVRQSSVNQERAVLARKARAKIARARQKDDAEEVEQGEEAVEEEVEEEAAEEARAKRSKRASQKRGRARRKANEGEGVEQDEEEAVEEEAVEEEEEELAEEVEPEAGVGEVQQPGEEEAPDQVSTVAPFCPLVRPQFSLNPLLGGRRARRKG